MTVPLSPSVHTGAPFFVAAAHAAPGLGIVAPPRLGLAGIHAAGHGGAGSQYSANGQKQVVYFRTDDMASTRDWKAIPPAL